ncbi:MAG: SIMPL domain-containing protein [Oscillospiraceae bacterium]|nr:SIMPL domain-containing protein [Oscillospiraceae bacterium]
MKRTITVTGTGAVRLNPDLIVLPVTLAARDEDYSALTARSAEALEALRAALATAGFEADALKTLTLDIHPVFEGEHDAKGVWRQVFRGYELRHELRLRFPMDAARLAGVLSALADCPARPEFSVQFTVAEPETAKRALLADAARDARAKAETLSAAAGAALGSLLAVRCDWNGADFRSPTRLNCAEAGLAKTRAAIDVSPEEVGEQVSAVFVWELKDKSGRGD